MSAKDAMAAMLDELMGPRRNTELGVDTKVSFDDPHICKHYLVAFCPHDMFTNTKADLGPCPLVHDDRLRIEYPKSQEFEKRGYERDLLRFLMRLEDDNQRRIQKNKEKLRETQGTSSRVDDEKIQKMKKELAAMDEELKKIVELTEEAGNQGNVSFAMELVSKSEQLLEQKKSLQAQIEVESNPMPIEEDTGLRQKDVCETCGSMLIRNDAQCRVEEHLTGKMHVGFTKIQVTIKELKERVRQIDEEMEKARDRRKEERKRSRDHRSRSRDHDRRDRDRGNRDNDRRRHRSRSRERHRDYNRRSRR